MTLRAKRLARLCSLFLALSMLFSLGTVTSAVGAEDTSPTLSVSDSTLTLVDQDQEFTATLTVDASVLNGVEVSEWIAGLTWYLTRDEGFQDPDIYPYYYPGDRLNNWQVWNNGAGGEALFTLGQLSAVQEGNTVTVTQRSPPHPLRGSTMNPPATATPGPASSAPIPCRCGTATR